MKTLLLFKDLPTLGPVLRALGIEPFSPIGGSLNTCTVRPKDFEAAHVASRVWCDMLLHNLRYHLATPTAHRTKLPSPWDPVFTAGLYQDLVRDGSAYGLMAQRILGTGWRKYFAMGATSPVPSAKVAAQSR